MIDSNPIELCKSPVQLSTQPDNAEMPSNSTNAIAHVELVAGGVFVATALTACGGSGAGGTSSSNNSNSDPTNGSFTIPVAGYAFTTPQTPQQASHFLQQASFAASDDDIAGLMSTGYAAWIEKEFNKPISPSSWDWLTSNGYVEPDPPKVFDGLNRAIWARLITTPDVLRQRIALFLSELFPIDEDSVIGLDWPQYVMASWWDLLCENAFGNYRNLLEAMTLNVAMGLFLNTGGNLKEDDATGRRPDENFAREVLQLFTIGLYNLNQDGTPKLGANGQPIESYTQDTITQLAHVFTGWSIPRQPSFPPTYTKLPMVFDPNQHSMLEVSFLGTTIPANTDGMTALHMALDTIFQHPNVGPFIGRQLIQRLVTSNPSPAYVARVAAAFNNNGLGVRGDMRALIAAVLLDDEARGDASLLSPSFGKLREPILRFLQWARTFPLTPRPNEQWDVITDTDSPSFALGQEALRARSVFNFFRPGYTPPNSAIATKGLVAPEFQIVTEASVAGYMNFMQTVISEGIGAQPSYNSSDTGKEMSIAAAPQALVARLNLLLCAGQMSTVTETTISNAIATMPATSTSDLRNRVWGAVFLTMSCPDYLIQK